MSDYLARVQSDFDRIAVLDEGWNHNRHYYPFLAQHIPAACRMALEIGCGTGAFTRILAEHSAYVLGLDLSPAMIRVARKAFHPFLNIDFLVTDVTRWQFPANHWDCIVTSATLHHLPLAETLARMRDSLTPGGVLLVLDLFKREGGADLLWGAAAMAVSLWLRLLHTGRLRPPAVVRAAWAAHGEHDVYPTLRQVRQLCAEILPGAEVRRHLLWRYSIVWRKPLP